MTATDGRKVIHIHEPGGGRLIQLGAGGTVRIKVEGADSQRALLMYEFTMPPRTAGPPVHMHAHWDEAFYVLDGEVTFLIDGQEHIVPTGGCTFVAGAVPHTFWNASDRPATNLTVLTPSGLEEYFDAVSDALATGESMDAIHALMSTHGIETPSDDRPAYGSLPD